MKTFLIALISVAILILVFGSWSIVKAGERGVRVRFGAAIGTVGEGLNFKIPVIEKIVKMDVKVQKDEVDAGGASKDFWKMLLNYFSL